MDAGLHVHTKSLGSVPDAGSLLAQLHPLGVMLLDSGAGGRFGRTSILALPWRTVVQWRVGDAGDPLVAMAEALSTAPRLHEDAAGRLEAGAPAHSRLEAGGPCGVPFRCGWIALLSYETRHLMETLPARHAAITALPDVLLVETRVAVLRDELTGEGTLVWGTEDFADAPAAGSGEHAPEGQGSVQLQASLAAVEAALQRPTPEAPWTPEGPLTEPDAAAHRQRVVAAREHILAGDIYQANLAQAWSVPRPADTVACYRQLRRDNPPTFGGYLEANGEALLCLSPERFLQVDGRRVSTRPIKGTAARGATPTADAAAAEILLHSAKDRAELAMIVDILRNDLARVCVPGSVVVSAAMELEQHPTVHHLVAEVQGELQPAAVLVDLLRATLPGGSITGAPRIRAMEVIDALEAQQRGPYCGTLGWIGYDGRSDWNIIIRSAFTAGQRMMLFAGGGIVVNSVPEAEEMETRHKLAALLAAWR